MDVVGKKAPILFHSAFWLILFVNLISVSLEIRWLEFFSKALLIPSLAIFLWSSVSKRGLRWTRFLMAGLALAFVGDMLLFFAGKGSGSLFLMGMVSFLAVHIFFIRHYLRIRDLNGLSTLPNLPVMFILFAVAVVLIDVITSAAPRPLFFPLIIFGMTLATSTGMSAQAFERLTEPRAAMTVIGAILLMGSDITLGLGLTEKYHFPGLSTLVMLTYGTGMYLIVRGTLETMKRRKKKSGQASDPTGDFEEDLGDFETTSEEDHLQTS
jgi:uncharacterized membrane protein YhhN